MTTRPQEVLELVREAGVLRPRDLDPHGIPREYLRRLEQNGLLERVGRGLYVLPDADATEYRTLAEASKLVPRGVICLLSALRFHELTTQSPHQVWMAIGPSGWRPESQGPPIRIVHFSGPAFTEGVETYGIEGVDVTVYNEAKTVADCFKFRRKIGLDVALEALRDYQRRFPSGMDDLWRYAKICRVARVVRPYLEAMS